MKNTTFYWITVAVLSVALVFVGYIGINGHINRQKEKAERTGYVSVVDAAVMRANNATDELTEAIFGFIQ